MDLHLRHGHLRHGDLLMTTDIKYRDQTASNAALADGALAGDSAATTLRRHIVSPLRSELKAVGIDGA